MTWTKFYRSWLHVEILIFSYLAIYALTRPAGYWDNPYMPYGRPGVLLALLFCIWDAADKLSRKYERR